MSRSPRRALPVLAVLAAIGASLLGGLTRAAASTAHAATPTGSISGTVAVPSGFDVTRISVATRRDGDYPQAGEARVASNGTYTIGALAPGTYTVWFSDDTDQLVTLWYRDAPYAGATHVQVGTGAVTGIDATMILGATISGTVHTASDCNLADVEVTAYDKTSGVGGMSPASVQPDGTWRMSALPTGSYTVHFIGEYAGLGGKNWNGQHSPDGTSLLPVAAGQTITGIDVTLAGPAVGCVSPEPYIRKVYEDLLGREPDADGSRAWVNKLAFQGVSYSAVTNAITASDEFRSLMIDDTYWWYLDRGADASGAAYWLDRMRSGSQIQDIEAGFISSDEFYALSGGTPEGWVTELYWTVLGRNPSAAEVQWWVTQISAGMNRGTVARGFLFSTEHLSTIVDGFYVWLLGRHLDAAGNAYWVSQIQHGHRDEEIIAGIVSSTEYFSKVPRD